MWMVCYVNHKNHNEWRTCYDSEGLVELLKEEGYFDAEGNQLLDDLYIFLKGRAVADPETLYKRLLEGYEKDREPVGQHRARAGIDYD
jgi:hypothetical protein